MKNESYLMIVELYQEKYVEELIVAFTEVGIKDVMSFSGVNESRRLSHNFTIFAGFKTAIGKASSLGRIFIATVDDSQTPKVLLEALKQADIDLVGSDLGSVTLIPVYSTLHS